VKSLNGKMSSLELSLRFHDNEIWSCDDFFFWDVIGKSGLGNVVGWPWGLEGFWGVWKDYYSVILELVKMLCVMDQKLPKDHCPTLSKGWDK